MGFIGKNVTLTVKFCPGNIVCLHHDAGFSRDIIRHHVGTVLIDGVKGILHVSDQSRLRDNCRILGIRLRGIQQLHRELSVIGRVRKRNGHFPEGIPGIIQPFRCLRQDNDGFFKVLKNSIRKIRASRRQLHQPGPGHFVHGGIGVLRRRIPDLLAGIQELCHQSPHCAEYDGTDPQERKQHNPDHCDRDLCIQGIPLFCLFPVFIRITVIFHRLSLPVCLLYRLCSLFRFVFFLCRRFLFRKFLLRRFLCPRFLFRRFLCRSFSVGGFLGDFSRVFFF